MLNPLDIEQRYQDLKLLLSLPSTPYQRVVAINAFLTLLNGEEQSYESYVLECHERLPAYLAEVPACGYVPEMLAGLYTHFLALQRQVPAAATTAGVPEAMHRFRNVVAVHFAHAGAWERVLQLFPAGTPDPPNPPLTYPAGIEGYDRFVNDAAATNRIPELEREEIRQLLFGTAEVRDRTVLIPVVEKPVTDGGSQSGSLRRIRVRILGDALATRDSIETDIAVYGIDHAESGHVGVPMQAVRQWLRKQHSPAESKWYLGHVSFGGAHELHEGGSSGLAVAAALACEVLRYENARVQYRIRSDAVFTGGIDGMGAVLPVDADTLLLKINAAFFSPVHVMVVPRSQADAAEEYVRQLQARFPVRSLEIVGVRTLADVFYDLRAIIPLRAPLALHAVRFLWMRRSRTLALISTTILIVIGAWYGMGRTDNQPIAIEYEGDRLRVMNRYNATLAEIEVGKATVDTWGHTLNEWAATHGHAIADADGDGQNELFYVQSIGAPGNLEDQVVAYSIREQRALWSTPIRPVYNFPGCSDTKTGSIVINDLVAGDVDGDGRAVVFVAAHHVQSFPGIVVALDPLTGNTKQAYVNTGHIADIALADLDRNGVPELLMAGTNNAFLGDRAFLAVIDACDINGCSPFTSEYRPADPPAVRNDFYALLPRSVFGESIGTDAKGNAGLFLEVNESLGQVTVCVDDGSGQAVKLPIVVPPILNFTFNRSLKLTAIARGDSYDVGAAWAVEHGFLTFKPDDAYFVRLRERLRVWEKGKPFRSQQ